MPTTPTPGQTPEDQKTDNLIAYSLGGIDVKVNRFIFGAIALLLALLALVAVKQGAFTPTTQLYFYPRTAYDLNKGMAVKLIGFKVGTVKSVNLEKDMRVKVTMMIDTEYAKLLGKN